MILDLGPLPWSYAQELLEWCVEHRVDLENCEKILRAFSTNPCSDIDWTIDIPDKYVTYFLLKWSSYDVERN